MTLLPASDAVPHTSSAPLIAPTRYWRRSACRRRAYSRRILTRLPHVAIEHHRRRPLVSRNSQPQLRPGAAAHAGEARRVGQQRDRVDRDGEADGARLRRRPSRRQAPSSAARAARPPPPRRGRGRAPRGRPRARPATLRERPRRRGAARAAARARPRARRRRRPAPPARTRRAAGPSAPGRRRVSSASVAGVSGSPADDQSTLLAKSRHRAPPQSLIVSGVTRARMSYRYQP